MLKTKFNPATPGHKAVLLTALGTVAAAGFTPQAEAGGTFCEGPGCQESHIETMTTDLGGGLWDYDYTVFNDSDPRGDIIVDWELPYFGDEGITDIRSPDGWDWTIETIGVFGDPNDTGWEGVANWQTPGDDLYVAGSPYNDVTQVLHWFCMNSDIGEGCFGENSDGDFTSGDPIFPNFGEGSNSLGGFGFEASFGPTDAPYQASWAILEVNTGDPPIPGQSGGAGPASPRATGTVPEPGTLALAALGALGAFGAKRRRRRFSSS